MPTLKTQSQTYLLSTEFGLSFWYNQALLYVGLGRDTHLSIPEPVTTTPPENGHPPPFLSKVPLPPFSPAGLASPLIGTQRLFDVSVVTPSRGHQRAIKLPLPSDGDCSMWRPFHQVGLPTPERVVCLVSDLIPQYRPSILAITWGFAHPT